MIHPPPATGLARRCPVHHHFLAHRHFLAHHRCPGAHDEALHQNWFPLSSSGVSQGRGTCWVLRHQTPTPNLATNPMPRLSARSRLWKRHTASSNTRPDPASLRGSWYSSSSVYQLVLLMQCTLPPSFREEAATVDHKGGVKTQSRVLEAVEEPRRSRGEAVE